MMRFQIKDIAPVFLVSIGLLFIFSSCFTGIESTKKITLSREEKKIIKPTEEELFFTGFTGTPVEEWREGQEFYVTDNKAILIFEPHGFPLDASLPELEGDTLTYVGVESRLDPAGNITLVINFSDGKFKYPYNTGRPFDTAISSVRSDQIPMLIDLQTVNKVRDLLKGQKLWTKTLLWYDEKGERINGKKFVPVTIEDVEPGNMVFPLRLKIKDEDDNFAWLWMNFGIAGTDSRSFPRLFSMSDPKRHYSSITDENWKLICEGNIARGMTKEECRLSLGNPIEINSGHDYSQTLDIWTYENGVVLWFVDGVLSRYRK